MKKLIFLIVFSTLFIECEKINAPDCMQSKIDEILAGKVWNPPAKIYQYTYNGQKVFYFPPRCCDIPSILFDKNCNVLCNPDGGYSGGGDGRCPSFFSTRTNEKLILEDKRH
jgi:hypothetical protein